MRRTVGIVLAVLLMVLTGCASSPQAKRYNAMAKANPFEYFFSGPYQVRTFETLEEASDFINAAKFKLPSAIGKSSVQGLAAKLSGPQVTDTQPVVVVHFLNAFDMTSEQSLTGTGERLQNQLRNSISVSSVYLVFFGDRGVSISDFYLDSSYRYTSNSQYPRFFFKNATYETNYPIGWGVSQAFKYLEGKVD